MAKAFFASFIELYHISTSNPVSFHTSPPPSSLEPTQLCRLFIYSSMLFILKSEPRAKTFLFVDPPIFFTKPYWRWCLAQIRIYHHRVSYRKDLNSGNCYQLSISKNYYPQKLTQNLFLSLIVNLWLNLRWLIGYIRKRTCVSLFLIIK